MLVEAQLTVQRQQALPSVLREASISQDCEVSRETIRVAVDQLGVQEFEKDTSGWMQLA